MRPSGSVSLLVLRKDEQDKEAPDIHATLRESASLGPCQTLQSKASGSAVTGTKGIFMCGRF